MTHGLKSANRKFRSKRAKLFGSSVGSLRSRSRGSKAQGLRQRWRKEKSSSITIAAANAFESVDTLESPSTAASDERGLRSVSVCFLPLPVTPVSLSDGLLDSYGAPFKAFQFIEWFTSAAGGAKGLGETQTMLRTVIRILLNVHQLLTTPAAESMTIIEFSVNLVRDSTLHQGFHSYLTRYPWKPNTMCSHLYQFKDFLSWLRRVPQVAAVHDYDVKLITFFKFVVDPVISTAKKALRKAETKKDNSRSTAVYESRYPTGGLSQLVTTVNAAVEEQLDRYTGAGAVVSNITAEAYSEFMEVLFAAIWVLAPQGRPGGIASLKMKNIQEFTADGFALSSEFKTAATYVYQPVILAPATKRLLLEVYVPILRPMVEPVRHGDTNRDDPLFLLYSGKSGILPGRLVQAFFRRTLDILLTITAIRGMIETEAEERLSRGEITQAERNSILDVNGHSGTVANEFYVRNEARNVAMQASGAFGLSGLVPSMGPVAPMEVEQWGLDHPDRAITSDRRARWTTEERDYLHAVIDAITSERGGAHHPRLMAACLRRIKEDKSTRRIFHKRHIMSTDRLRAGYRQQTTSTTDDVNSAVI